MSVHKDLEELVESHVDQLRSIQAGVSNIDDRVSKSLADLETILDSLTTPNSPEYNLLTKVINDLQNVIDELY